MYRLGVLAASSGCAHAAPLLSYDSPLRKITYAVATADLNVGYPYATLPKALGYYQQEGLDVEIVPGQSSAAVAQLLLSGRADVGLAQPDPIVIQRVKLPSALPALFAGLELAIVLAIIAAVVSEFLGAVGGLGYRILTYNTDLDMAGEFAALAVLSLTGFVLHAMVRLLGQRLVFWGHQPDGARGA